jgi:hypothetical protein
MHIEDILEAFDLLRALEDALDFDIVVDTQGERAFRLKEYTRQLGWNNHWYEDPIREWKEANKYWGKIIDAWVTKMKDSDRRIPRIT